MLQGGKEKWHGKLHNLPTTTTKNNEKKIKKMNVCYEIVACKENEWYGNCEYSVVCGV